MTVLLFSSLNEEGNSKPGLLFILFSFPHAIHSFIHPFVQHVFIEDPLCRVYACWGGAWGVEVTMT